MDARVEQKALAHESPEPGVVAASVYAGGRCISDIAIDEAGNGSRSPVMLSGSGCSSPATIYCHASRRSSGCTTWRSRMPARRINIRS